MSSPLGGCLKSCGLVATFLLGLILVLLLQRELDQRLDVAAVQVERLAQLPSGDALRPALLGYHHLGADVLWLHFIQVLGKKRNTADEYQWMYHALDVITTLDPNYAYAYQVGGIVLTDLGHRADLSNRILEKGMEANPEVWWLPFNLGYNYYFHLHDPGRAAEYVARAAKLSGGPAYLPGLATRMYAEANNPDVALEFLEAMWRQADHPIVKAELETRMKELVVERDIGLIEVAITRYEQRHGMIPARLGDLVHTGELPRVPSEPFGGEYLLDPKTGRVWSSTHPTRLHVFRPGQLTSPPRSGAGVGVVL